MDVAPARNQLPQGFERLNLTPSHFHIFYTVFIGLRFPLKVAEVLDLRSLINHAVDDFTEPPLTPDYRQFRDSLEKALDSFAIDNDRHRQRLLKGLAMMRELHVAHLLESRHTEERYRMELADNTHTRGVAVTKGLVYLIATVLSVIGWFAMSDSAWMLKALSALCAVQAWLCFRSLPKLDRRAAELRLDLNTVLRDRINAVNWKTMIHKLALVLGFKQIKGVEVFRMESEHENITTQLH
jgi:hypothetical protein